jgi:hypothetical protein
LRTSWALVASVALLGVVSGCGGRVEDGSQMRVAESKARLVSLLGERGIKVGLNRQERPPSMRAAWEAFKAFASLPVASSDLGSYEPNDDLLYEFGVYDWGDEWGRTFQVSFTRQYGTADGDIQQVQLVAHYPPSAGEGLGSSTVWGSLVGGKDDDSERTTRWIESVEASQAFRRTLSHRPLGYEVWPGSAE